MNEESREQLHISVRKLVEFLFREGDIDEGSGSVDPVISMREGQRIHKKIQNMWHGGYVPEVPVKILVESGEYDILIDGRADGVKYDAKKSAEDGEYTEVPVLVEEIKGVYLNLETLEEPVFVHKAQAMCYAYIFMKDYCLESITVRMTYCNLDTEEIKFFEEEYSDADLVSFWEKVINDYRKWADFTYEWKKKRNASILELDFPYEYRKGQRRLVGNVYKAIVDEKPLFVQAPTGSGKTVSTLYPSIQAVGRGLSDRIFYLTGKTVTKTVALDTINLLEDRGAFLKSIEITAKDRICPNEERHCNPDYCPYAKGHFDRVNDAVYAIITENDIFTRELVTEYAEKYMVCPFEFSLDISLWCDIIIGDYNYVFHPTSYLKRFFAEAGREKYVFLIDEAHNLVDRGRSMYSETLCKEDFLEAKKYLKNFGKKLTSPIDACNRAFLAWKKENPDYLELPDLDSFVFKLMNLCSALELFFEKRIHFEGEDFVRDFYFKLRSFRNLMDGFDEKYKIYAESTASDKYLLHLYCMDPSRLLQERLDRAVTTVFFSATLLPMDYYGKLLCTVEKPFAAYARTVFSPNQQRILIGSDVTTKYTERSLNMYEKYATFIYEIARRKTGNYIVFCPSYKLMEDILERFSAFNFKGNVMVQNRESSEAEKQDFLDAFQENPKESMVAFSVMGGLYSEGIDLTGDRLIGVIVIGTGLPMVGREREILKEYFDKEYSGSGFDYAYLYPGICKVLQAAGRLIRTEDDRGIVALLDKRFNNFEYKNIFPKEWENILNCNMNSVGALVDDFWN